MGGPPAFLNKLIGSLISGEEPETGEVKPLQNNLAKNLEYNTEMLRKFTDLQHLYNTPPEKAGKFLGSDPLDPGGPLFEHAPVGWGVDAGAWKDEQSGDHPQGGFDNWMMQEAALQDPVGSETRQQLYDKTNNLYDALYNISGGAIPAGEIKMDIGGKAPAMNQSKTQNMSRVAEAIKEYQKRIDIGLGRFKSVHPGTNKTFDDYMNSGEVNVLYPK